MAKSNCVTHRRINNLVLMGPIIGLGVWEIKYFDFWPLVGGFLLATYLFSPDNDLGPRSETWPLSFFTYSYKFFFRHRGLSHNIIIGPISRLIYWFAIAFGFLWITNSYYQILFQRFFISLFIEHSMQFIEYKAFYSFVIGHWLADISHIMVDKIL